MYESGTSGTIARCGDATKMSEVRAMILTKKRLAYIGEVGGLPLLSSAQNDYKTEEITSVLGLPQLYVLVYFSVVQIMI